MKHTEYIIPIGEEAKDFDEIFIGVLKKHKELIRCKDCKFWHTSHCPMAYREYEYNRGNEPNDFCSLAEKREE